MLLGELLQKVPHESCVRFSDREIRGVCTDSRQVSEGDLFVCLSGGTNDGHDFARQAVSAGAAHAVYVELGTSRMAARPFLLPACQAERGALLAAVARAVQGVIAG